MRSAKRFAMGRRIWPWESVSVPAGTMVMLGTLGLLLVAGSIMLLVIASPPALPAGQLDPTDPPLIQGARALRPDLLRRASWPFPEISSSFAGTDGRIPATTGWEREPYSDANPAIGSRESKIRVVACLYRSLPTDPAVALRLLSPELLAGQGGAVARSWSEVVAVRPRKLRILPDGTLVAQVVADYRDGGRLMLWHRFVVEQGPKPRIVAIELLAARNIGP